MGNTWGNLGTEGRAGENLAIAFATVPGGVRVRGPSVPERRETFSAEWTEQSLGPHAGVPSEQHPEEGWLPPAEAQPTREGHLEVELHFPTTAQLKRGDDLARV